jgi:hypothetical protein
MKLRTILFSLSTLVIMANAGFFDHDKAYYDAHPKEAESKFKECDKAMAHAMIDKDKGKFQEIRNDAECKASGKAYREYKNKLWKIEHEAKQKKRAEEKAKKEAIFNKEYPEQLATLEKMLYAEFYMIKDSCGYSGFGNISAKCKAYQDIKKKRKKQALEELISRYNGDNLIAYRKKTCKEQGYQNVNCGLAISAAAKDEKDTIARLKTDKVSLKKVFNECSVQAKAFRKKMKWTDANALTQSFKCRTAMAAARDFGVFGLSQPMK